MGVAASSRFISTLGVKMTRRVVIRPVPTIATSATEVARSPKRIVPTPGTGMECPSVAHAFTTSPMASHAALMVPRPMPARMAASLITLLSVSLLYSSGCITKAYFFTPFSKEMFRSTAFTLIAMSFSNLKLII